MTSVRVDLGTPVGSEAGMVRPVVIVTAQRVLSSAATSARSPSTTARGFAELLRWASQFGIVAQIGVEGSWRAGLARWLREQGLVVAEVDRPNRRTRRRHSKSDGGRRTRLPPERCSPAKHRALPRTPTAT